MIESLKIRNYQKHERLTVQLSPGVTSIVGPSDAGKSAIIRAMRWVCMNSPAGDAFKRQGAEHVAVRIRVDGHTITRKRGATDNTYHMDGAEFRAFGSTVPVAIQAALCLAPINFQGQHDTPFWFGDSGGQVARSLNAVVDLEVMDKAMAAAASGALKAKAKQAASFDAMKVAKTEAAELKWADAAAVSWEAVGALAVRCKSIGKLVVDLGACADAAETARCAHTRALAIAKAANAVAANARVAATLVGRVAALAEISDTLGEYKSRRVPSSEDLEEVHAALRLAQTKRGECGGLLQCIRDLKRTVAVSEEACADAAEGSAELAVKSEGICPICGGELDDK